MCLATKKEWVVYWYSFSTLAPIVHQTQIAQCATDARALAERAVAGRARDLRAKSRVIRVKITRDQRVARSWLQCPCAPLRAEAGRKGRRGNLSCAANCCSALDDLRPGLTHSAVRQKLPACEQMEKLGPHGEKEQGRSQTRQRLGG